MEEILQNIIIPQRKLLDGGKFYNLEILPRILDGSINYIFSINSEEEIGWSRPSKSPEILGGENIAILKEDGKITIDTSINLDFDIISKNRIRGTEIYYNSGKMGIGIFPRLSYKFDISIPPNTLSTAFHIGDGSFGFSIGNGTSSGFLPQILGMGADESDAGLYLLGKSGNDEESEIPLIVIDGRNSKNLPHESRPILGITNGNYQSYNFIIDQFGRVGIGKTPDLYKVEIKGSVRADNFIIGDWDFLKMKEIIESQQIQINKLVQIIENLQS